MGWLVRQPLLTSLTNSPTNKPTNFHPMNQLSILEQKTVTFYDDELIAVRAADGHIYVALRQLCDSLGLTRQAQVRRIQRHTVLVKGLQGGAVLAPPSLDGRGGGAQNALFLRVDLVPLWLSGIRISAVKEEIRPKLERFQTESAKVLWEAFQEGRLTEDFESMLDLASPDSVEAYQIALAVVKIAREQIILQAQIRTNTDRIEAIEAQLSNPDRFISEDQAMEISQAVKLIAQVLGQRTKRNEHGAVYGELYRNFQITSYRRLPANSYEQALDWLRDWYVQLTRSGKAPF